MPPMPSEGAGALPALVKCPSPVPPDPAALYAALDLGTNSCRMLIARPKGNRFRVVDSFARSVQLGAGLEASGKLGRIAMARATQALRICRRKIEKHNVTRMRLVATEACRRADNAAEFICLAKHEAGLALEVITSEEEARLAVIACASLVSIQTRRLLVVDIGGGSTELVWIDLTEVPQHERPRSIMRLAARFWQAQGAGQGARVVDWISIPLGVATLRDQFRDVRDDTACFALMSWLFEESLADFSLYGAEQGREGFQIIGTSGTVTTVAATHLGLRRYDRNKVDGLCMTSGQIDRVIRELLDLGPIGRCNDPRIGRDRHMLIMPGVAILQALLRVWPTDRLSVADRGLREGLLYAQMMSDGALEDQVV